MEKTFLDLSFGEKIRHKMLHDKRPLLSVLADKAAVKNRVCQLIGDEYVELSEDSGRVIYIPTGVGHGFMVRSESASIAYLTSSGYAPAYEKSICPTDPALGIEWQIPANETAILSNQDLGSPTLSMAYDSGILPRF